MSTQTAGSVAGDREVVRAILYVRDEFTIDGTLRWEHGGRADIAEVSYPGSQEWLPRGLGGAKRTSPGCSAAWAWSRTAAGRITTAITRARQ